MGFIKKLLACALLCIGVAYGQELRLDRFAFGGCNIQHFKQTHWDTIAAVEPQLWVWDGDIIYADHTPLWLREAEYNLLKNNPRYSALRASIPIIGVWDDHDYGSNNQGVGYPEKEASKRLLLSFLDEPENSARWTRPGVYTSYKFGPPGSRAKIILLDGRSFREDPGPDAAMLGEEQWSWLLEELTAGDARVIFLVSGTQILPDEHPGEHWGQYPRERARLLEMLTWSAAPVVILSGDRHLAEITQGTLADGRPLYEFTSSGLTHSSPRESPNSRRVGPLYREKNFGVVELDWDEWPLQARLQIWGTEGAFIHEQTISLEGSSH